MIEIGDIVKVKGYSKFDEGYCGKVVEVRDNKYKINIGIGEHWYHRSEIGFAKDDDCERE